MHGMMKDCCGTVGKPDVDKVTKFMEHRDLASTLHAAGWPLFFI